ncbi:MAG: enoyl-CoA hydratase/isomerase family protein [Alphaproteobacteria bacterium]|nr:enoyl-CoA hydratase/isomerase family protein [Alphaproteobacteria bacterium]MBV9372309.1 enoyl-CoA hydratase/isomerase family protein [Alphaproteobacteria bacterium]MBV9899601.1 enoyl-CoA hydratase/isomerase family protein [Alphaproteobacteria bacterium]
MASSSAAPAAEKTQPPAFRNVIYDKEDGVAYVTFNRPAVLNALNAATVAELRAALEDARDDPAILGVVLTGAGDRAFAAGADIAELAEASAVEAERSSRTTQETLGLLENLGKPVVAAVNGFALGGGCEAALACTIRIASPNARFGLPEVKLGVLPGGGGTQRLPRLIGKGRALQLILTGGMIGAEEAYRIGLVNEVVAPNVLNARAEEILHEIAANAPIAVGYALKAVNSESKADGLALEASYFGLLAGTEDKAEGTSAFLAKRAPRFRGR